MLENLGKREYTINNIYLAQEVEMWLRESEGREEKDSNVAKLQPLNYTEFEVGTSPNLIA